MYHWAARDRERHFKTPPDLLEDGDVTSYCFTSLKRRKYLNTELGGCVNWITAGRR
jgi:hypothetical protein